MFLSLEFESDIFMLGEWHSIKARVDGDKVIIERIHREYFNCETETATVPAAEFFKAIENLHIEKWEDNYFTYVSDGESWTLDYKTDDGKSRHITGSNAYPENYDELLALLY